MTKSNLQNVRDVLFKESQRLEYELKANKYLLIKGLLTPEQCLTLCGETTELTKEWYTQENIWNHSAYISDDAKGRKSWAFALENPNARTSLPCVHWLHSKNELFAALTTLVIAFLNLPEGRILFNIQKYWEESTPVHLHRDGEVFDVDISSHDNRTNVIRALHPSRVCLLTLFNNAEGGGTRIMLANGTDFVVQAQTGDLLVFDNIDTEHGVEELVPKEFVTKGDVIRQIIGWRSLDYNCKYLNKRFRFEPFKHVSFGRACELHENFLKTTWIQKRNDLILFGKIRVQNEPKPEQQTQEDETF